MASWLTGSKTRFVLGFAGLLLAVYLIVWLILIAFDIAFDVGGA